MNHFNNNDYEELMDEPWVSEAVKQLRQPVRPSVAAQLRAARRSALEQPSSQSRFSPFFLWGAPTLAGVVAIMLTFGFWQKMDNEIPLLHTADAALEDLSIIKAPDDLEFYQNIEFLQWMEQVDNGLTKG